MQGSSVNVDLVEQPMVCPVEHALSSLVQSIDFVVSSHILLR